MVTTAYIHCASCDLIRTFDGDHAHRQVATGQCMDPGQVMSGIITGVDESEVRELEPEDGAVVLWKGKGKA